MYRRRALFVAEDDEELFSSILLAKAPALEGVPAAFASLVMRMLEKDARRRPAASELMSALAELSSVTPRTSVAEGDVIAGKYRIDGFLGAGGMGTVMAATHLELGTRVALKMLRTGAVKEARAASQLESEHVARVVDVGKTDDGTPFLVMEHLSGTDLARHLAARGPLSSTLAVKYMLQTCRAIAEAHALGIVHRDLKPSNLFLAKRRSGEDVIKVLDFGISKTTDDDEPLAHGSLPYMAPEQGDVDARSDIFSLGVVLHELVTGRRPGEARPPRELAPVIARCLEVDPARRFQTVAELAGALTSRPRRRVVPALLAGIAVVACAAWLWPSAPPAPASAPASEARVSSAPAPTAIPARDSVPVSTAPPPAPIVSASPPRVTTARAPAASSSAARRDLDLSDPALLTR